MATEASTSAHIGEIEDVQRAWGDGVVAIGAAARAGEDPRPLAENLLDELYAYEHGHVLFKPTKASMHAFRNTHEGALSYFIGGNPDFPEDSGFALKPWKSVAFDSAGIVPLEGGGALAMGYYVFTDYDDVSLKVEYSFGYLRDDDGKLRIHLHHSSLPYGS